MIKKYEFGDTTQLSLHFNAKEFRCKCGKEHETLLSEELVDKLEKLYAAPNCSKIIVTSGYRCADYDKNVGGSGTGQHTKVKAAGLNGYGVSKPTPVPDVPEDKTTAVTVQIGGDVYKGTLEKM